MLGAFTMVLPSTLSAGRRLLPHSFNTHAAQGRSSAVQRDRGKQRSPQRQAGKGRLGRVYSGVLFEPARTQGCRSPPADARASSLHPDLFVGTSPNQNPVSRLPPLRLRLCGRTPCSSRRPERSRLREEPELKSPQLRRWRLSRPGRPHGFLRTWKGTQKRAWVRAHLRRRDVSWLLSRIPAYGHGLQSRRDPGTSWTAGGNE